MSLINPFPQISLAELGLKILPWAIVMALAGSGGFWASYHFQYSPEHDAFTTFKAKTEEAGKVQAEESKAKDKANQEALQNAKKQRDDSIAAIKQYYATHPVVKWMYHSSSGSSTVSGQITNSGEPQRVPSGADEQSGFTSEECVYYANELKGLLDLLHSSPSVEFEKRE